MKPSEDVSEFESECQEEGGIDWFVFVYAFLFSASSASRTHTHILGGGVESDIGGERL
jgi:hypothetical protein